MIHAIRPIQSSVSEVVEWEEWEVADTPGYAAGYGEIQV
jgi:hypothetical protein